MHTNVRVHGNTCVRTRILWVLHPIFMRGARKKDNSAYAHVGVHEALQQGKYRKYSTVARGEVIAKLLIIITEAISC